MNVTAELSLEENSEFSDAPSDEDSSDDVDSGIDDEQEANVGE